MPYNRTVTYPAGSAGAMPSVDLDPSIAPSNAVASVVLNGAATGSFSLQYTLDDFSSPYMTDAQATWFTSPDIPLGSAANVNAAFVLPVTRIRVVFASLAGGSCTLRVLQGMSIN